MPQHGLMSRRSVLHAECQKCNDAHSRRMECNCLAVLAAGGRPEALYVRQNAMRGWSVVMDSIGPTSVRAEQRRVSNICARKDETQFDNMTCRRLPHLHSVNARTIVQG